jgi:hypothetical protein
MKAIPRKILKHYETSVKELECKIILYNALKIEIPGCTGCLLREQRTRCIPNPDCLFSKNIKPDRDSPCLFRVLPRNGKQFKVD